MEEHTLYRKYRPKRFKELAGQSHIAKALQTAIVNGTTAQAYLFTGVRGTGKTSTARILAKTLNCQKISKKGEPCCKCDSCLSHQNLTSYDLHEIDTASNNKVEDIRELISKVGLGSPGAKKIYILDEAHMLTTAASNALLKTLEEPPSHVIFVLCTTEAHKLLDTIRSRCQVLNFGLLSDDVMTEHLKWVAAQEGGLGDSESVWIDSAVEKGCGSVRDALSALQGFISGGAGRRSVSHVRFAEGLASENLELCLVALGESVVAGEDLSLLCQESAGVLRDSFLVKMGMARIVSDLDTAEQVGKSAASVRALTSGLQLLGESFAAMRSSANRRLEVEFRLAREFGASVASIERNVPVEAHTAASVSDTAASEVENVMEDAHDSNSGVIEDYAEDVKQPEDMTSGELMDSWISELDTQEPERTSVSTKGVVSTLPNGVRETSAVIKQSEEVWDTEAPEDIVDMEDEKSQQGLFG